MNQVAYCQQRANHIDYRLCFIQTVTNDSTAANFAAMTDIRRISIAVLFARIVKVAVCNRFYFVEEDCALPLANTHLTLTESSSKLCELTVDRKLLDVYKVGEAGLA